MTAHICANQLCFVSTVFLPAQSDEIRRHKCATFPAPSMIQDLHPEDTQGTGRAGCTQDSSDHSLEKLAVPNETATTPTPVLSSPGFCLWSCPAYEFPPLEGVSDMQNIEVIYLG